METQKMGTDAPTKVTWPTKAIPSKFVEPILYLAEKMARTGALDEMSNTRMVDKLAALVGVVGVRKQRWYREYNERKACEKLDIDTAKTAALVVLTLVMKVDTDMSEAPKSFFSRMRKMMNCDPIAVPSSLEEHVNLAAKFLVG